MRDSDFPREEMDLFFETAAAAFRVMKTKGLVYYDASKAVFTYGSVGKCFRYGIYYLNMGLSPDVLAACLEWRFSGILREDVLTEPELLEIALLKHVFKYYQMMGFSAFLEMCNYMCTDQGYNRCAALLA